MDEMQVDVLVIGGGSAGFAAAEAAAAQGVSVALVEKERLGGECPNWACIPTKALLRCARAYREVKKAHRYGVISNQPNYSFQDVIKYKNEVVHRITGGGDIGDRFIEVLKELGVQYIPGIASLESKNRVHISQKGKSKVVEAKSIVICAGTHAFIPPIEGIEEVAYWTFRDAVSVEALPESLVIIGAGPVGVEFATFFSTFGTKVSLVQLDEMILSREEPELAEVAADSLKALGVQMFTGASARSITQSGHEYDIEVVQGDRMRVVRSEQILLAAGKRADIASLNLDVYGITLTDRRYINVNKSQQTSLNHIFAAGDVTGGMQFTHTAHHEGSVAGHNAALAVKKLSRDYVSSNLDVIPRVTFCSPELASVGMTEEQAGDRYEVKTGLFPVGGLGRSATEGVENGIMKLISDAKTDKILGGSMIGPHAGEVIHEIALAIKLNATTAQLGSLIHAFPTFSEIIPSTLGSME